MVLLINNDTAEGLVEMDDALVAMERAFKQLGESDATFYPRTDIVSPTAAEGDCYCWGSLLGATRDPPRLALRFKSDILVWDEDEHGDAVTEWKFNDKPGTYMGFILLFDTTDGTLLALINDGIPQHIRVGATAGVACDHLAVEDATEMGVLGSGGMARTYSEAFSTIRDLERIRVYSPTKRNREAFATEMEAALNINVVPVSTAEEAMNGVDIAACCTDAASPVYDNPDWLTDHAFLVDCSPVEVAPTVRESITHTVTTTNEPYQARFIGDEINREEFQNNHGGLHDFIETNDRTLSEVLTGKIEVRPEEQVYYRNRSAGIQFAAIGDLLVEAAIDSNQGFTLPIEWFQQSIRD